MSNKRKKVTIYDVARRANTSATTVSRVLNGTNYPVKEELKRKILQTAELMNYSPNILAKSLKNKTSKDIGVIIPTISNPFYSAVLLGIEEEADKNNYNILLCNTFRSPEKEKKYLQSLYEKQVTGVILSTLSKENIIHYMERGINFVLLDQKVEDIDCSIINFDCRKGAYMAVEYLLKNGHKKIAFVSSPLTRWTRTEIFEGYKMALKKNRIDVPADYVLTSDYEEEHEVEGFEFKNGKAMADIFIHRKLDATAVMCVNDMTAFGFIQQISKYGKNIPADISVMGFDDISFANMFTPPLTTIRYPGYEVGILAGKILFDKLHNSHSFPRSLNLNPKLIIRNSVQKIQ